jgi:hypothetical protein
MLGYPTIVLAVVFGASVEMTHNSVSGTIMAEFTLTKCDHRSLQRRLGYIIRPTYVTNGKKIDLPTKVEGNTVPCGKVIERIDYAWSYWSDQGDSDKGVTSASLYIHCASGAVARYEVNLVGPTDTAVRARAADFGEVPGCIDD